MLLDHLLANFLLLLEALSLTVFFELTDMLLSLGILVLHTFMLLLFAAHLFFISFKFFIGTVQIFAGACLLGTSLELLETSGL